MLNGGGRGIRTPGTLSGTTVFKTAGINRSPIPPRQGGCPVFIVYSTFIRIRTVPGFPSNAVMKFAPGLFALLTSLSISFHVRFGNSE